MGEPIEVRLTLEDYDQLPDDRMRYEVLEGQLVMTPAPSYDHQSVLTDLVFLIETWNRASGKPGRVLTAPFDVILADDSIVQPDLIYIAREHLDRIVGGRLRGLPDLVVEVFHHAGLRRDRITKRQLYARYRIPEYWLVDTDERSIEVLTLVDGRYATLVRGSGDEIVTSQVLQGLALRPAELSASLPDEI